MQVNFEVITSPMISPWIATDTVDNVTDRRGATSSCRDRLKTTDSVEKVVFSSPPPILTAENEFLHVSTRNLSPNASAQIKDFKLTRVLFRRRNYGRLFQQNRPRTVLRKGLLRRKIEDTLCCMCLTLAKLASPQLLSCNFRCRR